MDKEEYTSLDFSIIYRCMHKYYDIALSDYDINAGQVAFLIILSNNEGISLANLANICSFDKGTVTKGIQKLEEKGYVKEGNSSDKRVKLLYLTEKAKEIMPLIYMIRRDYFELLTKGVSLEDIDNYLRINKILTNNSRKYLELHNNDKNIRFFGLQKTTLLDYPGKLASTIFTGGCNFRCPFCHNSDLVFLPERLNEISKEDIINFVESRKGILDGVCISGGEPLIHGGIIDFIKEIKALGLSVKLDTNGFNYLKLKELIDNKLVDYVAMDIKNSLDKYPLTIGLKNVDLTPIKQSVELLKEGHVDYEFRTTIVKEYHDISNIKEIGLWLKGAKKYYLQSFRNGDNVIDKNLNSHDSNTLNLFKSELEKYIEHVEVRGVE